MRAKDIQRQNGKWVNQVQVSVEDIGAPKETANGLCQPITVVFDQNVTEVINYFFNDTQFAVDPSETGKRWYNIRYKDDYFQCCPCDPKEDFGFGDDDGPDWDAIAKGKCRHKHVDKLLERMMPTDLMKDKAELKAINELVEFEAKGIV